MTNRITTPPKARTVIVDVDTHKHVHVAVAIDRWGIRLGDHAFVADSGGYEALVTWAETHGRIEAFGIEGTGSYGAGLARAVHRAGHHVVEVNRGVGACIGTGPQRSSPRGSSPTDIVRLWPAKVRHPI